MPLSDCFKETESLFLPMRGYEPALLGFAFGFVLVISPHEGL